MRLTLHLRYIEPNNLVASMVCLPFQTHKQQTPNRVLLDMSQLARGLYLIRVETTQGFYQEKLIKE